ncbi:unnamed protein product, partial [Ceratitis capitata]
RFLNLKRKIAVEWDESCGIWRPFSLELNSSPWKTYQSIPPWQAEAYSQTRKVKTVDR